ncbi:MAG: hypothetical protein JXB29_09195 [Sedimentisphaerales bacterium]|nr:hypothetical protein [Sedimentisphaerales bacterium]
MDNFNVNPSSANQNQDKPIHLEDLDKPIPIEEDSKSKTVSHSPINLGSPASSPQKTEKIATSGRITGVKTFFTKLHPGAIEFMDEQIADWLKANPGIEIKTTNTIVGEVQAKKTEPNIIISVWY